MPDSEQAENSEQVKDKSPDIARELIDVLLRGLASAKARAENGDVEQDRGWCVGYYRDENHQCALLYQNSRPQ